MVDHDHTLHQHPGSDLAQQVEWNRAVLEIWRRRLKRWIPRLVWLGDEVDVCITFPEDPLREGDEIGGLFSGGLFEIEKRLRNMGIGFDTGQGCGGRDWEWDWSLQGPMRIKFRGRAQRPHLRVREKVQNLRVVK
jgi:hypothetical protein